MMCCVTDTVSTHCRIDGRRHVRLHPFLPKQGDQNAPKCTTKISPTARHTHGISLKLRPDAPNFTVHPIHGTLCAAQNVSDAIGQRNTQVQRAEDHLST